MREELSHYSNATTDLEFLFRSAGASFGVLPSTDFEPHKTFRAFGARLELFDSETDTRYVRMSSSRRWAETRVMLAF